VLFRSPDVQNKGINAVLINEVWKVASRRGIKVAETGPELETNDKIQSQWKHFEARQHRRRRCYLKMLRPAGAGVAPSRQPKMGPQAT